MVSGLKHFAYFYPACSINTDKIYMPKKDKKLPIVLSIEEILILFHLKKPPALQVVMFLFHLKKPPALQVVMFLWLCLYLYYGQI